jgi:hypothetical protein
LPDFFKLAIEKNYFIFSIVTILFLVEKHLQKYKVSDYKDCPFYGKFLVHYTGEIG